MKVILTRKVIDIDFSSFNNLKIAEKALKCFRKFKTIFLKKLKIF